MTEVQKKCCYFWIGPIRPIQLKHCGQPTETSREEEDRVIPVGCGLGAGRGKVSLGRGRHNGKPVCASAGTSQYVVLGYGCIITLRVMCVSTEDRGCVVAYSLSGLQPLNQCSSTSTRFHPIDDVPISTTTAINFKLEKSNSPFFCTKRPEL